MKQLKYVSLLFICIVGNPIYQIISFIICDKFEFKINKGINSSQIDLFSFFSVLIIIFITRLIFYTIVFKVKLKPFSIKHINNFILPFLENHIFYLFGILTFKMWTSTLEGNITGFLLFPLSLVMGLVVSITTIKRLSNFESNFNQS